MYYWTNYAMICNGEVKNITVGDAFDCLQVAIATYGNGSEVVCVSNPDIPVRVGDKYRNGKFYRGDEEIKAIPNESELLKSVKLKGDNTYTKANTNGTSIVDIENAILELYELIGG